MSAMSRKVLVLRDETHCAISSRSHSASFFFIFVFSCYIHLCMHMAYMSYVCLPLRRARVLFPEGRVCLSALFYVVENCLNAVFLYQHFKGGES